MRLNDQVFNQAELLAGDMEETEKELLRLLCGAAVSTLRSQLRQELTPEDCREDFVAAASLYALAQWYQGKQGQDMEEFSAGDLTVKQGAGAARSPEALKAQALALLKPYRVDSFRFMGV